ncbi:Uu.00g088220.m01.CDS01 [Anthostomella pinea]|uniref:Mediator of RNA polymerase II transcription subunit 19 n=1 Tax=Anthostomella pinea TaxID=933095 RepID=A0AAI8YJY3_9PEZI|nr:Uu.00g088220.m01.CDS01 [Anthostomella pinea]
MSFSPQTPQSPSQFSPSTADLGSSMNTSMPSIATSLPTPAHSVNGSGQPADHSHDTMMTDEPSHKRKYPFDDMGGHEQKKVHLEDPRRIGIENLHLDVGEKYLLCRTPHLAHSVSSSRMSEDLFEKFGLTGIAAEVARTKPNGDKNALRKTYKGQIKTLGLSGHFDVVKKEPSTLMELLSVAEDDWNNRAVLGKEIERGFSQATLATLPKATTMSRGPIPKNVWDSSVLGDLAPGNMVKKANQDQSARPTAPSTPTVSATGPIGKASKPLAPPVDRARRLNKKRSYQDSSFVGYEGYDDDTGGYSTGDGEGGSKLKRRKQNPGNGLAYAGGSQNFGART